MRSFFYVSSKTESAGLSCESARVARPLPLRLVQGCSSSQWESAVCMMMAEEDESLELLPLSKNTKFAVREFFR